ALSVPGLLLRFVVGAVGAVGLGLVVARAARWVTARVTDTTGRSALTLVLPFAVYLAAEEVHAADRAVRGRHGRAADAARGGGADAVRDAWARNARAGPLVADDDDRRGGLPARAEIVVIASTVLVATLLLPGFTLPTLV